MNYYGIIFSLIYATSLWGAMEPETRTTYQFTPSSRWEYKTPASISHPTYRHVTPRSSNKSQNKGDHTGQWFDRFSSTWINEEPVAQ